MLVAASIYEACKYYALFRKTSFAGHCALVTSYNPQAGDITLEDTGENIRDRQEYIYDTYTELLKMCPGGRRQDSRRMLRGSRQRKLFLTQPATMKLLIVRQQASHWFRRAALHLSLYRQIDRKIMACFRPSVAPTVSTAEDKEFG